MSKVSYYLQRSDDTRIWEEVDEYVWENASRTVLKDGVTPRYTDARIAVRDGVIDICAVMTDKDLGIVCRFLSIRAEAGSYPGGFLQTPEYVKIKRNRYASVYELGSKAAMPRELAEGSILAPGQKIMGVTPIIKK